MGVPKTISNRYLHEDHCEGIINPKFQLSISSGWCHIADFKIQKYRPRFYRPEFESAVFFLIFVLQS